MTSRTILDVSTDGKPARFVIVGLFEDDLPKLVESFVKRATGKLDPRYNGSKYR